MSTRDRTTDALGGGSSVRRNGRTSLHTEPSGASALADDGGSLDGGQAATENGPSPENGAVDATLDDWSVLGPLPDEATGSMAIGQSIAAAREAISANKLRSFLTALGIIIGVGAVIIVVALGDGASAAVQQRLAGLGTNLLTIVPGSSNSFGVRGGNGSLQILTEQDGVAIQQQVPGVDSVSPILEIGGAQVVAGGQNWNTRVQAGYPSMLQMQNDQVAQGAAFDQTDESSSAQVADIGPTVATNLFGTANPVGQTILIRNVPFTVKGVLVSKGSNGFQNADDIILIPYSTAQVRLFNQIHVNSILVQVGQNQDSTAVMSQITSLLNARHNIRAGQSSDFRVFNNAQVVQTAQQTTNTLTFLLAGVAAVSLIVGGIGIMNIMMVSVTERTREIGIELAIGATKQNVLSQFLVEAVLLSVLGGIVGIALGVTGAFGLSSLAGWTTLVTPGAVLLSFGFAAAVGIFFGYYPARKASQLDPIKALRYE